MTTQPTAEQVVAEAMTHASTFPSGTVVTAIVKALRSHGLLAEDYERQAGSQNRGGQQPAPRRSAPPKNVAGPPPLKRTEDYEKVGVRCVGDSTPLASAACSDPIHHAHEPVYRDTSEGDGW